MSVLEDYGVVISREKVTQEMIDDILCSAFEGGINYWAATAYPEDNVWPENATYVSECLSRGVNICIEDLEEDDELGNRMMYVLSLQDFVRGLEMAVIHRGSNLHDFYENHDAEDADIVVQFAIFGRIVYG